MSRSDDPAPVTAEETSPAETTNLAAKMHSTREDLEHRVEEARAQFDATNEKINARVGRNLFAAIGIGLGLGALLLSAALMYANSQRIHRDEGLQPYLMSPCSGLKASAPGCTP